MKREHYKVAQAKFERADAENVHRQLLALALAGGSAICATIFLMWQQFYPNDRVLIEDVRKSAKVQKIFYPSSVADSNTIVQQVTLSSKGIDFAGCRRGALSLDTDHADKSGEVCPCSMAPDDTVVCSEMSVGSRVVIGPFGRLTGEIKVEVIN